MIFHPFEGFMLQKFFPSLKCSTVQCVIYIYIYASIIFYCYYFSFRFYDIHSNVEISIMLNFIVLDASTPTVSIFTMANDSP